ncbi:hypothetical protein L1887_54947 [Cichorium endivia]|nr:hypothetical protein L1887_54947 [Cichorium endivia]
MEALNSTLEFEAAMARKYNVPFEELIAPPPASTSSGSQPQPQPQPPSQVQTLSAIFDPYLGVFVDAQDRALSEMFVQYRRQGARISHDGFGPDANQAAGGFGTDGVFDPSKSSDPTAASSTGSTTVLPSSTELFYFYRQTLEQCARLSNREPLRDLYQVYRKWLRVYAEDVLRSALLRPEPARRSIDVRPNIAEIQKWCLVLNTADYCATTAGQLEDKLREKIHADFKDAVSLDDERSIFNTLVAYAVQTLARELELCSEPIWNSMLRPAVPWSQIQPRTDRAHEAGAASANSQYVTDLASLLEQIGVVVRQDVENKRYVRSWCDKVVSVVTTRFLQALVRLRPLSQPMADQLLADASALRKSLVDLPRYPSSIFLDTRLTSLAWDRTAVLERLRANLSHWTPALSPEQAALSSQAASYVRYVHRLTERIDVLLRVVLAPIEPSDAQGRCTARPSSTRTLRSWPTDRLPTFKRGREAVGGPELLEPARHGSAQSGPCCHRPLRRLHPRSSTRMRGPSRTHSDPHRSLLPIACAGPTVGSAATFESQSQPGGAGRAFSGPAQVCAYFTNRSEEVLRIREYDSRLERERKLRHGCDANRMRHNLCPHVNMLTLGVAELINRVDWTAGHRNVLPLPTGDLPALRDDRRDRPRSVPHRKCLPAGISSSVPHFLFPSAPVTASALSPLPQLSLFTHLGSTGSHLLNTCSSTPRGSLERGSRSSYRSVTDALDRLQTDLPKEGYHMSDGAEKLRWGCCIQEVHEAAGFIRDVGIQARTSLQILVAELTPLFCHSSTASSINGTGLHDGLLRVRAEVGACANLLAASPLPRARLVHHVPTALS